MKSERWKKQTIFHDSINGVEGNCMQACIASLFNIPLGDVPNFAAVKNWFKVLNDFVKDRGFYIYERHSQEGYLWIPRAYTLVAGQSSRGCKHLVIYKNGVLFHDPHPSNEGIKTVEDIWFLVPIDPAEFKREIHVSDS